MGRYKGGHNTSKFRQSQRVIYRGKKAQVINNTGFTLIKKIKIEMIDTQERILVSEIDLIKGWK
jgi:hypothetical protein